MNKTARLPLVLILMGPPGAGKGTHSNPLSQHLAIPHISTGDLFRSLIRGQTPLGKIAKSYIDQGKLVPDELVLEMLFSRITLPDCAQGYILDGFPRTVAQGMKLEAFLENKAHVIVLNFNLPDDVIIERITGRLVCKECGRPFHKLFAKPQLAMVCDGCNGPLYQRDDDSEAIIVKRLEVYREQTAPLIDFYKTKPGKLFEINSEGNPTEVFRSVIEHLESMSLPFELSHERL